MNNYIKQYSIGETSVDIPKFKCVHQLPLLSFGDAKGDVALSMVLNTKYCEADYFNIANGIKLNLQKKLVFEGSNVSQIIDVNGDHIQCYRHGNVYTFDDNTRRILRIKIVNNNTTYELENPDFSTEIFDDTGKIMRVIDKYGDVILSYEYNTAGLLSRIAYRPNLSAEYLYKKSIVLSYTNSKLNKIEFRVNNNLVEEILVVETSNDVRVQHYSGVYFVMSNNEEGFDVYSTANSSGTRDEFSQESMVTISDSQMTVIKKAGGTTRETTTYDIVEYVGDEEKDIEITDNNGVITHIKYFCDKPQHSYEVIQVTDSNGTRNEPAFTENSVYAGSVMLFEDESAMAVSADSPCALPTYVQGSNQWEVDMTRLGTDIYRADGEIIVSGWIKCGELGQYKIVTGDQFSSEDHFIPIYVADRWKYFTIKVPNNNYNFFRVSCNYANAPEIKDLRLCFKSTAALVSKSALIYETSSARTEIELNDELEFKCSLTDGSIVYVDSVKAHDVLRYLYNKTRGITNEFYANNCKQVTENVQSVQLMVDNTFVDLANCCFEQRLSEKDFVTKKVYDARTTNQLKISYIGGNDIVGKTETYNAHFDLIVTNENGINKFTNWHSNGLTSGYEYEGTGIYQDNEYDEYFTKLEYVEDEFGTRKNFTTDENWGVVVATEVIGVDKATYTMTNDKKDLLSATFGDNSAQTSNNIEYCSNGVAGLNSGELEYLFNYLSNDLSSISKKKTSNADATAIPLKTFSYADNYKTVTATTHTTASESYVTKKTIDKYGRTIGLFKTANATVPDLIQNTYGFCPYFVTNTDTHSTYGDGFGSNVLSTSKDCTTNLVKEFGYDEGNVTRIVTKQNTTRISDETYLYDDAGRVTEQDFKYGTHDGSDYSNRAYSRIEYEKGAADWGVDNRVREFSYTVNERSPVTSRNYFDNLQRPIKKSDFVEDIVFRKEIGYTKSRVTSVADFVETETTTTATSNTAYSYDALGRIVGETDSVAGTSKSYVYDMAGRLVRENNSDLNKTYTYVYDSVGNVTSKKTHAYTTASTPGTATTTTNFSYDTTHSDRLTSFGGKAITYDQQGCPLTYDGRTYTWTRGKLTQISKGNIRTGRELYTFTYNGYGQRTEKIYSYIPALMGTVPAEYVSNEATTYTYDHDGRLVKEHIVTTYDDLSNDVHDIHYLYDDSGIIGMVKDSSAYYFHRNIQGDVVGVYNSSGTKLVTFTYDAYGNCSVSGDASLASYCKIRYRGYYFDTETGLYWVQTRYYNPEWCRWISPDSIGYLDPESAHGLNLYAYCGNDPINYVDPSGHIAISISILCGLALVGMGLTIGGVVGDNNLITAIGLTMVAVLALISGVGAIFSGATYLSIIGGVTAVAGVGTGMFATAEYQEAFTGNNWMLDAGMSEEWYNGLMLATAAIATAGTVATGILTSVGNAATPNQMMNSFNKHPNRWKTVKELVEPGRGANKGGISTYTNYINKWTGSKLGIHKIIRGGRFIHGPHFHPWF